VIDRADQVERLLAQMRAALPMPARMTQYLLTALQQQSPTTPISPACHITEVHYAGDEGGIVCHLAREGADESGRLESSIGSSSVLTIRLLGRKPRTIETS